MQLKYLSLATLLASGVVQAQTLNDTISGNNLLSNLTSFISQFPGLLTVLSVASNITVLAPSNDAFSKFLNSSAGLQLAGEPDIVQALLEYHVLNGTYSASEIQNNTMFIPTLLTNSSFTNVTGGQRVEATTDNGNVTFFSGLDQESGVVQADVNFTGGVIHIVDTVLTLPMNISSTVLAANLTSLWGALNDTGLATTVDDLRDVTVFAPSNDAFQAIGPALENLTMTDLGNILTYHVVNGTVGYSTSLSNTTLQTANGNNLTIRIENGTVFVNSAKVIMPDVLVANGVVHVIDNVLNPNNTSAAPSGSSGTPAFPSASSGSGAPFTSGVPTPTATVTQTRSPTRSPTVSSSTTSGAAVPMRTGAIGPAMLFGGGAAVVLNL